MNSSIIGDTIVQIPVVGESIALYKFIEEGEFFMDLVEGIELTKEGRLTVTTEAKPQIIKIYAVNSQGETYEFHIQLIESWTLNYIGEDGMVMKIPKAEEVTVIGGPLYNFAQSREALWGVRIVGLLISIAFILLYITWKKRK